MADKLKVFVSSCMRELRSERQAVKAILEANKHVEAWVYEDDVEARDQSVQATYLQRLGEADAYLGIFWKKYGQYTIDEFEHAHAQGKHKMVFVKSEEDESVRDPDLLAFLDRIGAPRSGIVTPSWFKDMASLEERVDGAVTQWIHDAVSRRREEEVPPLLAYRCDRHEQQREIIKATLSVGGGQASGGGVSGTGRHVVCFIEGHHEERLRAFVKVVAHRVIPDTLDPGTTAVRSMTVSWPGARKYPDFREDMLLSLSDPLLPGRRSTDMDEIAGEMDRHIGPVLLTTVVPQAEVESDPERLVGNYVRFWNEWPVRTEGLLFAFLCIEYADPPKGRLRRLLGGDKGRERIRKAVRRLAEGAGDGAPGDRLRVLTTPEVRSVTLADAEEWAELEDVTRYVGGDQLSVRIQDRISKEYRTFEEKEQLVDDGARMGTLAPALEGILQSIRRKEI